jgi:hypothetical protein
MSFEPSSGRREVVATERRRKQELALAMRHLLAEELHPRAEKIRVVSDNLSRRTRRRPSMGASRRRLPVVWPAEDRVLLHPGARLVAGHGRGGDLSVLVGQCLERRLPDIGTPGREAEAWCAERNGLGASVHWRLRTEDARTKLRSLYPSTEE